MNSSSATTSSIAVTNSPANPSNATTKSAVQEFSIRVPKNSRKKFNIMRFNSNLNVDLTKWTQVKMERENNKVEKHTGEEMPKYGAGSEYRREEKEDARRRRFGYVSRTYNSEDQPWILKCGGKTGKKFKGIREGGVGENAAYYVFTHGSDGSIEAYPAAEWYNFQPIQRFKALSAEEAELEFGKRNKSLNYFSLMKRFGKNEEEEKDEESSSKKRGARDLKISDMDDWIDSDDDDDMGSDENGGSDNDRKSKKKKKAAQKKTIDKKKAKNSDESAFEESDDGDEEGRELDYISDSSEDISDHEAKVDKELKGVDEEDALRKLLDSDEEEEENENEEKKNNEEGNKASDQDEQIPNEESSVPASANKKKRKRESTGKPNSDIVKTEDTSSEFSAESSDSSDLDKHPKPDMSFDTAQASTSAESAANSEPAAKRPRLEMSTNNESVVSEEAVRRYLMRKPMTAKELLQKFKKSKTNLSSEQLVNTMTQILKRINPNRRMVGGQMQLSLMPDNSSTSNS